MPETNDIRERLIDAANAVRVVMPPFTGFALFFFDFGDKPGRRLEYISNAQRPDVLRALKEFIAKQESADVYGKHLGDDPPPIKLEG